jgi:outer membrane immunogenic protein
MKPMIFAAALICATPALAADFTGPRVEVRIGYDNVGATVSDEFGEESGSQGGFAYGGGIGYDFAISPQVILGVETNFSGATTEVCNEVFGLDELCVGPGFDFEAAARLGYATGKALVYAKVGYANSRIGASYVDFEGILPDESDSVTVDGIRLGVGLEYAVSAKQYLKLEYLYTNYANETGLGYDVGLNRNQIIVGFGLRF